MESDSHGIVPSLTSCGALRGADPDSLGIVPSLISCEACSPLFWGVDPDSLGIVPSLISCGALRGADPDSLGIVPSLTSCGALRGADPDSLGIVPSLDEGILKSVGMVRIVPELLGMDPEQLVIGMTGRDFDRFESSDSRSSEMVPPREAVSSKTGRSAGACDCCNSLTSRMASSARDWDRNSLTSLVVSHKAV